jgi:hypothetical protein
MFHYGQKERGGVGGDFVDELIHGTVDSHYDSDWSDSLHETAQSKINYLKTCKVQEWKINIWICGVPHPRPPFTIPFELPTLYLQRNAWNNIFRKYNIS